MTSASSSALSKAGLLAASVFGACWGGVLAYWRTAPATPSGATLALLLLGLPALLLLVCWAVYKEMPRRAGAPSPATPAQSPSPPSPPSPTATPLSMLGAAVHVPHATSPAALAAALAGQGSGAGRDPELVDDAGFPLMTARCEAVADARSGDDIAAWLRAAGVADPGYGEEQWRTLALAGDVLDELVAGAARTLAEAPPPLELACLLPATWTAAQRQAARGWLLHRAVRCGWTPGRARAIAIEDAASPVSVLGRLAREAMAAEEPRLLLLVAADSALGSDSIERGASEGVLFSASNAQGVVPGEGAAGLLLAAPRHAADWHAPALLDGIEEGQRASPADPALLATLADRALRRAGVDAADLALLVADTGHRAQPAMELLGYAGVALPGLYADHQVWRAGLACGSCAAVPLVAALALAWHEAQVRQGPVLCVGNEDARGCCVAVVRPACVPGQATHAHARGVSARSAVPG